MNGLHLVKETGWHVTVYRLNGKLWLLSQRPKILFNKLTRVRVTGPLRQGKCVLIFSSRDDHTKMHFHTNSQSLNGWASERANEKPQFITKIRKLNSGPDHRRWKHAFTQKLSTYTLGSKPFKYIINCHFWMHTRLNGNYICTFSQTKDSFTHQSMSHRRM